MTNTTSTITHPRITPRKAGRGEEYPALPEPGDPSGMLPGGAFAETVTQV
ncbi:hypothetical protein [Streptomyces sp. IB2014 016-6]|nr:hypothetical protein [Streptomyces sp. IB2014 016-6]